MTTVDTENPASTPHDIRKHVLLVAFMASGFSGLIYESLWTHCLKLFLGHAAYAQTLVLGIFMGGLATGSWLCSRRSRRWSNLLAGYALAEAIIGAAALLFHLVFTGVVDAIYFQVIPALRSPWLVAAVKWTAGAALILPQSILLGMTFPLMAGGFIRAFPERPGASLAILYCCNSIGAVAGVLTSGFLHQREENIQQSRDEHPCLAIRFAGSGSCGTSHAASRRGKLKERQRRASSVEHSLKGCLGD